MSTLYVEIAPSILSADFARLADQVQEAEAAGADLLHIDVMDGQFVPPITFGALVVAAIRPLVKLPLDIHMMVVAPERMVPEFAKAGADYITVHVEATTHLHQTLQSIRSQGAKPGAALNPATPLSALEEVLGELDLVNLMTVNPGYAAQQFIPAMLPKIGRLREMIDASGRAIRLEVDGGMNPETAPDAVAAGADLLVAGSAVFNSHGCVADNLAALRSATKTKRRG